MDQTHDFKWAKLAIGRGINKQIQWNLPPQQKLSKTE